MKEVTIYTDGSSRGNPGPGGYGAVVIFGRHRKRIKGGFRRTTNNRMEILAALEGLLALTEKCKVTLYSDSRYLVDAMSKGWIQGWRRNGWARKGNQHLKNADLWKRMMETSSRHEIQWKWVKGHAGNEFNEICDQLATSAADAGNLPPDIEFEQAEARNPEFI